MDEVVKEASALGVQAQAKACDVCEEAQIAELVGFAVATFGRLDVVRIFAIIFPNITLKLL
jgi:NAD(P)-dependent dehydrogenase (short-subunit alcohol dehydrogenase family)